MRWAQWSAQADAVGGSARFGWFAAAAVTVGMGAAMLGGAGLAAADSGSSGSDAGGATASSASTSTSSDSKPAGTSADDTADHRDDVDAAKDGDTHVKERDSDVDHDVDSDADHDVDSDADDDGDGKDRPADGAATTPVVSDSDSSAPAGGQETTEAVTEAASQEPAVDSSASAPEPEEVTDTTAEGAPSATALSGPSAVDTEQSAATPRAGPWSAAAADTTAGAGPDPLQQWIDDVVRQLQYIFANRAPTIQPGENSQQGQTVSGVIKGQSNNGFELTFYVDEKPKYGTVTIDRLTGAYTYSPSALFRESGVVDYFTIVADNGAAAKLPGLAGLVQETLHRAAVSMGLAEEDTLAYEVLIDYTGRGRFGHPASNAQYFVQQHTCDCAVVAVASTVSQLKKQLPQPDTEDYWLQIAKTHPSIVHVGMIWLPDGGISFGDTRELLRIGGMDVTYYQQPSGGDEESSYRAGQESLGVLKEALLEEAGVIVAVNSNTIWSAIGQGTDSPLLQPNHAVTVIGLEYRAPVDPSNPDSVTNSVVYINDGGLLDGDGRGLAVPLGVFMWAWESGGFQMVVAENPDPVALPGVSGASIAA
jgi:hypothetical protein